MFSSSSGVTGTIRGVAGVPLLLSGGSSGAGITLGSGPDGAVTIATAGSATTSELIISTNYGVKMLPAAGPNFGSTSFGGFAYRLPTESMAKNFFLWRGGQYLFEDEGANWYLSITPSGVNVGSPADNTSIPVSKFEVYGNASIGSSYARTYAAPADGLLVQGSVGLGTAGDAVQEVLHVRKAVTKGSPYYFPGVVVEDSSSQAAGVGGGIAFRLKYHDDGSITTGALIDAAKINGVSGNYATQVRFWTRANGSPPAVGMTLSDTGALSVLGTGASSFAGALNIAGIASAPKLSVTRVGGDASLVGAADVVIEGSPTGGAIYLNQYGAGDVSVNGAGGTARFLAATEATTGGLGAVVVSGGIYAAKKIVTSTQLVSNVATGTAPLIVASTTNVANLNASSLGGATFAAPGAIGGGTPGTVAATTLTTTGKLTNYNSVATVSNGVPAEYATVDLTAQSGAVGPTTMLTPATTGMFRLSCVLKITTAGTSPVAGPVTITYSDGDGSVAQSHVMALQSTTGTLVTTTVNNSTTTGTVNGSMVFYAVAGTAIQYAIAVSGTFASGRYSAHLKLEAL